jgi:autotransporter adhesin
MTNKNTKINNKFKLICALTLASTNFFPNINAAKAADCDNAVNPYISFSNVCVGDSTEYYSGGNTTIGNNARTANQSSALGNSSMAIGPYNVNWDNDNYDGNTFSTVNSRNSDNIETYRLNKVHGKITEYSYDLGDNIIGSRTYDPTGAGTWSEITYVDTYESEDVSYTQEYYSIGQKSTANYLSSVDFYQDLLSNNTGQISPFTLLGKDWSSDYDNERGSTAFGYNATASLGSNAIGNNSVATNYSNALGAGSFAQNGSSAIGYYSQALNLSNAMGYFAYAEEDSVAIGTLSSAYSNSVAIGSDSVATESSVALGRSASATAANSVALGTGSIANRANTVSIGSAGSERQITNVAPGTFGTDAVNVNQLNSGLNRLDNKLSSGVAMAMAMGGGANVPQGKNNAFTMAVGGFSSEQAISASYATVVSPNSQINASVGYGVGEQQVGARIGATFSW